MRRRAFIAAGAALAAWPPAFAQAKPAVIGYLVLANPEPIFGHLKDGLKKLGYVEGGNLQIHFRTARGDSARLAVLAEELVALKVDVLVAAQTPAITAARKATGTIPIVMAGAGDPVATGLIASLARPGGNITGTTGATTETGAKLLELVREVLPSAKRLGVLANATDPFTKPFLGQLRHAAGVVGVQVTPIMVRKSEEFEAAFADMLRRRTDAVVVQPSLQRKVAAATALRHRLPAFAPQTQFPAEGGLLGYSADLAEMHRNSAVYVDRILKGAKPADLPVQQPTIFELVINLKTAKALGITVPQSVLVRADRVIE